MCRFASRPAPLRPAQPAAEQPFGYGQPLERAAFKSEDLDLDLNLTGADFELPAADMELLGSFFEPDTVVLGAPVVALPPAFVPEAAQAQTTPVDLQMQALLQQQALVPPPVFWAQYQALLQAQAQQQQQQQQQEAAGPRSGRPPMPTSRRGRTAEEVAAQQERIKKRRRESAQRSRNRKNSYMHDLEVENEALREEVGRLRRELGLPSRAPPPAATATNSSSCQPAAPASLQHRSFPAMHKSGDEPLDGSEDFSGLADGYELATF